jgi:PAS domain-containing protein
MDGSGRARIPTEVAADVVKVSGAPVYAPIDTFLGVGIVGGYMDTFEIAGIAAADLVVKILARGDAKFIPPPVRTPQSYRVDARQLQRWGLPEGSLPAGTAVLFKEPTLWEQHRDLVLATIGVFALLTTILVFLSVQMIRRRRAEASLKQSEQRMAFAAASSNTGLWQYGVATRQLWATDHCRSMFGLDAGPLAPARFLRAVHPDDRRLAAAAVRSAVHGGQTVGRHEFRVVHANGQKRWLSASGHVEFDNDGKPVDTAADVRITGPGDAGERLGAPSVRFEAPTWSVRLRLVRGSMSFAQRMFFQLAHERNLPIQLTRVRAIFDLYNTKPGVTSTVMAGLAGESLERHAVCRMTVSR